MSSTVSNTSFRGQAALVTGGAVRLGKAIALALAAAGFDIALHYHSSQGPAAATQTEIQNLGVRCELFPQNLGEASNFADFMAQVKTTFPRLSLLINSASGYQSAHIMETSVAQFDQLLSVNLRAPFFLSQAFAGNVDKGNIINILDNKIGFNQYYYAAYLLTKKAFAEFTKMAALELAPALRVNGVAPGVVLPAEKRAEAYVQWRVQGIPLKRHGSPQNITSMILHILENDFLNGQIFVVDGGEATATVGLNSVNYGPGANKSAASPQETDK